MYTLQVVATARWLECFAERALDIVESEVRLEGLARDCYLIDRSCTLSL